MLADTTISGTRVQFPGDDLADRVERTVHVRTGGRIRDLHVHVQGDDVVISGIACTYYAKQLATHAALGEMSHRTLTNAIEVR